MTEHPFARPLDCAHAEVEDVPIAPEYPTGWKFHKACACPAFVYARQTHDVITAGGIIQREVQIAGCAFNLSLWAQGDVIGQVNKASADAEKNSATVEKASRLVIAGIEESRHGRAAIERLVGLAVFGAPSLSSLAAVPLTITSSGSVLGEEVSG